MRRRAGYSLFIFVQRSLKEAQGIDQPSSKAQLLSRCAPEAGALCTVFVQIKLLLSLFADQFSLLGKRANLQSLPMLPLICCT